jgi:hypothetical protein
VNVEEKAPASLGRLGTSSGGRYKSEERCTSPVASSYAPKCGRGPEEIEAAPVLSVVLGFNGDDHRRWSDRPRHHGTIRRPNCRAARYSSCAGS